MGFTITFKGLPLITVLKYLKYTLNNYTVNNTGGDAVQRYKI